MRIDGEVFDQVYQRLRSIAHRERARGGSGTLNTTAIVHEAYLDICGDGTRTAPRDFYAYAAQAMRNLLVDEARRKLRVKRGGDLRRTDFEHAENKPAVTEATEALELDEALVRLALVDGRAAKVVELHYFGGLELKDIAETLEVSERTINRDWRFARAWLQNELSRP
jgi:RNA polymerase sigma factor (TIGR02999 family)